MVGGVDVIAQHEEEAEHRGERAADVAHDVDDTVGLGAQGLGRDVRHESDGGVAVHHHKDENDGHHCDHPGNVVIVEEQRDKRECDRRNERADKDIRHALADLRVRSIRKTAEERQKDERGKIVARHDDADDPLHMQDVVRVARLEIGGRHAVEPAGEDIRQKCGAPGVVHLPEQENTEKGKADEKGPLVIELHCCFLSARNAPRASLLYSLHHTGKTLSLQPVFPALQYRYEVIPMKQCKKAGTIAAAAIGAAAAGYLFLIAPGRSRAGQRFPFRGQNIAHRGLYDAAQGIPENSLAAFRAAAEGGYGAELDTRLTKDGVVVVSHDSNIRRMTGADVTVESLDYAELQQYKLGGTEERVPRFSDALDILAAAHVPVIVEVKASPDHRRGELCRKVLEIIDAHTGNFCVESFDPFIVAWFRFHAPDLLRGQLTAQRDDLGGNLGAWLSSRMLIGCIGRPQFIAHRTGKKSLGVKLAELLGAMRVTWTAHDRSEEAKCDTVIFEAYRPPVQYK